MKAFFIKGKIEEAKYLVLFNRYCQHKNIPNNIIVFKYAFYNYILGTYIINKELLINEDII